MAENKQSIVSGPAAAAALGAGIGVGLFGVIVAFAEGITGFRNFLAWSQPVGALSGETILAVAGWIVAWIILGSSWRSKEVPVVRTLVIAALFFVVGVLLTFPPIFRLWATG
jgi:hypothetical protein